MIYNFQNHNIDLSKVVLITEALYLREGYGWYVIIESLDRKQIEIKKEFTQHEMWDMHHENGKTLHALYKEVNEGKVKYHHIKEFIEFKNEADKLIEAWKRQSVGNFIITGLELNGETPPLFKIADEQGNILAEARMGNDKMIWNPEGFTLPPGKKIKVVVP